jgi:4-carboxymuconolactone decarboxylase
MLPEDPAPRMPPVQPQDFTEETRAFFGQWTGGIFQNADQNPVLRTFAHHPALANAFSVLNVHLLSANTLPVKQRQIAIMRTAWICDATYMWSSHLNTSRQCGLAADMYGPIQRGASDPWFSEFERVIIRATDELVQDHVVGDANWHALSAEWNEQQLLDFLFTVGCYAMVAGVMRSTGVQRDADLRALAEQYGAPAASPAR